MPDATQTGRRSEARLVFARGGGTCVLAHQHVPYPFHITKPFRLYPQRPDLVTLYLQSASGGLYRCDHLSLGVEMRAGAAAHVTTQAATVVHRSLGEPARQETEIELGPDAFLGFIPDPLILFPGAALVASTRVRLEPGARAIVAESVACHDPEGSARPFDSLELALSVETPEGVPLVRERARITGADFLDPASPLGGWRACGTLVVLGPASAQPDPADFQAAADGSGCRAGVSPLPNAAGLGLRLLAPDGGTLSAGLEAAARLAFAALTGLEPARRRK
ncbi:urease accessory protein UreD [Methylobacterium planeticum]|uniref:Urease accessory protein UreD n=1 Tax=Methylobacterium planeticum TaxID=2615211 RepID=A0A6N6MBG7_9HYPH|nr:urease accessory protein UreD [Methylobacterium planeticum]KAB1067916.1 urease accessory protein UreD [Methylobacterium planeticum]